MAEPTMAYASMQNTVSATFSTYTIRGICSAEHSVSKCLILICCRLLGKLLDVVVAQLPLLRVGPGARQRRAARQQQPAAAATESKATWPPGKSWSLAEDLLAHGEILCFCSHIISAISAFSHSVDHSNCAGVTSTAQGVAAVPLYRALLLTMPASAHAWYHELRDKNLAQAITDYTVLHESSFLLNQELGMVEASHTSPGASDLVKCLRSLCYAQKTYACSSAAPVLS